MTLEFQTKAVSIPPGRGRRHIEETVTFNSRVARAAVSLNRFKLDDCEDDHHLDVVEADTNVVSIDGRDVTFAIECQFADDGFDNGYSGFISATVLAEVASVRTVGWAAASVRRPPLSTSYPDG